MARAHTVAVIEGDGIGPELVKSALTVLAAVAERDGFEVRTESVDGGADTYRREGTALTDAGFVAVREADATLKGPVGLPEVRFPDGTEAGLLGGILRNGLDLYANVRPIALLPGVESRLRVTDSGIDYVIVRENTEGLYAARGKGVGNERAMADTLLVTRVGCERIARYAFELALRRSGAPVDGVRRVTLADKANVLRSMYLFRQVFLEVAADYPTVEAECRYVDAMAQALVMEPERFDVIVTENMFGDILSDLGGGTVGGVALCPGGNIGAKQAYFEPIHGSAPTIAGQDKANPLSQILATAMMLDHLQEQQSAEAIRAAVRKALSDGTVKLNRDGTATEGTAAITAAVVAAL
jgi:3-isopropylmalate dehydrogenase